MTATNANAHRLKLASKLVIVDGRFKDNRDGGALPTGTTTHAAIARVAKLTPQHVGRVLRGEEGVTFDTACEIADAAGVGLEVLRAHIAVNRERARARAQVRTAATNNNTKAG